MIKKRQMIKNVSALGHDELMAKIGDCLNDHHDVWFCTQIDYFNMIDEEMGSPSAFMLFETLDKPSN